MKLTGEKPTVDTSAATAAEKKRKKRSHGPLTAALAVVAVLLAAAIAGITYAQTRETVYPNVYIEKINLGGMTVNAAAQALRDNGYESGGDDVRAIVELPNDDVIEISAEEAGIKPDASLAATQAYAYGRESGMFSGTLLYFKGLFGARAQLSFEDVSEPDYSVVRAIVQPYVAELNAGLSGDSYKMTDTAIEVYKGAGGVLADVEGLAQLVIETLESSLSSRAPVTAQYTMPPDTTDGGIDWNKLLDSVFTEPVPAAYDAATQTVTEAKNGVSFDIAIAESLYNSAATGELVIVPLIITAPDVTTDELEDMIYRDVLAERTTYIDGTSNRLTNITLAAEAVNGTVLNPGDVFSYNNVVGKRTTEKGYKTAGAYANGRTVQEIGGGICQVSSTIYDCTLHADLEVVERRNHQFTVAYLPLGNDATVNWGTTDYQFKNSTEYPIRIEATIDGRNLTVKFIGTKTTDETIEIEYEIVSTRSFTTQEVEDESIEPGTTKVDSSGSPGYTVETYKCRYDKDGNLISRDYIARSIYNPHTKIILVPVGTLNPSPDPSAPGDETPDATETPDTAEPPEETTNPYEPPATEPPATDEPVETPVSTAEPEPTSAGAETGELPEPTANPTPDALPPDDGAI